MRSVPLYRESHTRPAFVRESRQKNLQISTYGIDNAVLARCILLFKKLCMSISLPAVEAKRKLKIPFGQISSSSCSSSNSLVGLWMGVR